MLVYNRKDMEKPVAHKKRNYANSELQIASPDSETLHRHHARAKFLTGVDSHVNEDAKQLPLNITLGTIGKSERLRTLYQFKTENIEYQASNQVASACKKEASPKSAALTEQRYQEPRDLESIKHPSYDDDFSPQTVVNGGGIEWKSRIVAAQVDGFVEDFGKQRVMFVILEADAILYMCVEVGVHDLSTTMLADDETIQSTKPFRTYALDSRGPNDVVKPYREEKRASVEVLDCDDPRRSKSRTGTERIPAALSFRLFVDLDNVEAGLVHSGSESGLKLLEGIQSREG
ncbi:hypothetical protein MMC07_006332 [Pseudocyphellaria aurata]|nr:hypothetical protein [Pseudocyphellaria aurata]